MIILVLAGVLSYSFVFAIWHQFDRPSSSQKDDSQPQLSATTGSLTKGTPDFQTLLPQGVSIEQLGGWTRVSPPDRNAVYAFADTIGTTKIIVSQQPLPKEFSDNNKQEHVADLANDYHADRYVTASNGIKIFIGTSAKGPQSIIFTKSNTLVLIKSQAVVSDNSLIEYVDSLR